MIRFVPPLRTERYPDEAAALIRRWDAEWAPLRRRMRDTGPAEPRG